jgi:hypothetical protein
MTNLLDLFRTFQANLFRTALDAFLGRMLIAAGQPETARERLDIGLALAGDTGMHFYDAELLRLRAQTQEDPDARQADVTAALDLARHQGAKLFELRAALDDFDLRGQPAAAAVAEAARRIPAGYAWPELARACIAAADALAAAAHAGQVDKAGNPYVGHVRRVASYVDPANTDAVVAALLHDVIEDTGLTAAELASRGVAARAIEAVELLTRREDQPPAEYYQLIRDQPIAREVKLADLADNTDPARLATLSAPDQERLTRKYANAYEALGADFDDGNRRRARVTSG